MNQDRRWYSLQAIRVACAYPAFNAVAPIFAMRKDVEPLDELLYRFSTLMLEAERNNAFSGAPEEYLKRLEGAVDDMRAYYESHGVVRPLASLHNGSGGGENA